MTDASTCYRHRDRETYVRCTRCDRLICPDCMREAAVGFQCPDCVREGNKTLRARRTVFGGRAGDGRVTRLLLALNIAGFLYQLTVGDVATHRFGMVPLAVADGEYYRLLTAAFLHFGIFHIVFNMFALYSLGPAVEAHLGWPRYLALYLLSAFGGSLASYALSPLNIEGAGASGAIYGLFGAYFVINHRLGRDTSQILGLLGVNILISFMYADFIDWRAHLGGLAVGSALTWAYAHVKGTNRDLTHGIVVVVVLALVGAGVLARTRQLEDCRPVVAGDKVICER